MRRAFVHFSRGGLAFGGGRAAAVKLRQEKNAAPRHLPRGGVLQKDGFSAAGAQSTQRRLYFVYSPQMLNT